MGLAVTSSRSVRALQAPVPNTKVSIFSSENGRLICSDSECERSDALAKQVYSVMQFVDHYFRDNFGTRALNQGNPVRVEINWKKRNAVCSCSSTLNRQKISCSFRFNNGFLDPLIIAHEWVHAVIAQRSLLGSLKEAGALSESLADCLAMAFYKWAAKRHPRWQIVDRDLTKCPQGPISSNDVHAMSVIPSHAFYIAVQHMPAKRIGALAFLWFWAMEQSGPNETFASFAKKTISLAKEVNPRFAKILQVSWLHVGVKC